jgi:hypothetical protein
VSEDLAKLPWRTGRKLGRTIYAQRGDAAADNDILIGVMDTAPLAAEACTTHNHKLGITRPLLVLHIAWTQGGEPKHESYGTWEAREDDSHMREIGEFARQHRELTGCAPDHATLFVLTRPGDWVDEHRERPEECP